MITMKLKKPIRKSMKLFKLQYYNLNNKPSL